MKFDERDVEFQAFKGRGPGGQNKNKTMTCIRATHVPTGVVAIATSERSLLQNKAAALANLKGKLAKLADDRRLADQRARRDLKPEASFGGQIRTYRRCGNDQRVLDHRTHHEEPVEAVMRGRLEGFLRSFLIWDATR